MGASRLLECFCLWHLEGVSSIGRLFCFRSVTCKLRSGETGCEGIYLDVVGKAELFGGKLMLTRLFRILKNMVICRGPVGVVWESIGAAAGY